MNCAQIDQYLDEMLDGTLSDADLNSLEAHCKGCPACAEKLKANRQMMALFSETAPEIDVPLTAQAAWRGAVKREAQTARRRRVFRFAGGIAAALVVALGATFALRAPAKNSTEMMLSVAETAGEYSVSDDALIEADGAAEAAQLNSLFETSDAAKSAGMADMGASAPMHEIVMPVDDVDRVCEYALDLALEYEGTIEIQHYDEDGAPCANLYIDLPGANAAEFIEAMRHFDRSGAEPEDMDFEGETSLLLVLKSR